MHHMKNDTLTIEHPSFRKLQESIQAGLDAWKGAGDAVVELLDVHGLTLGRICEIINSPIVTANVLSQFERIGRNQVIPSLLVSNFPAASAMQKLPMSEQKRIMDDGVEIVVVRNGKADFLKVQPDVLDREQVQQVFTKTGMRSAAAQRLYIESKESDAEASEKVARTPWTIKGGKVIFREACEMSRHDLSILLTQLA